LHREYFSDSLRIRYYFYVRLSLPPPTEQFKVPKEMPL
jgi:hypothetical protein